MEGLLHIFPKILNMTLSASCAGVVVLLLRALLKKVPAGYFENTVRPALSVEQRNFYGRIPYCIKKTTSLV